MTDDQIQAAVKEHALWSCGAEHVVQTNDGRYWQPPNGVYVLRDHVAMTDLIVDAELAFSTCRSMAMKAAIDVALKVGELHSLVLGH